MSISVLCLLLSQTVCSTAHPSYTCWGQANSPGIWNYNAEWGSTLKYIVLYAIMKKCVFLPGDIAAIDNGVSMDSSQFSSDLLVTQVRPPNRLLFFFFCVTDGMNMCSEAGGRAKIEMENPQHV